MRRVNCFCTCVVQVVRSSLGARVTEYDFPSRLPLAVPSTVTAPEAKFICTRSMVISTVTVLVRAIGCQQGLRGLLPGIFGFLGLVAIACSNLSTGTSRDGVMSRAPSGRDFRDVTMSRRCVTRVV